MNNKNICIFSEENSYRTVRTLICIKFAKHSLYTLTMCKRIM